MPSCVHGLVLAWIAAIQPSASESPSPAPAAPGDPSTGVNPAQTRPADEEVIVVTGTRIQRPDRTSTSPVQSVRQEDFVLTGVANVEQTLNQLPQITPSLTTTSNNPGTGAATLDLRGLGSVRTLILVDGRRWIANDAGQVPEIDVNTIPAAMLERVDIVTGGASAVYGSDAVTGVINFILRKNFTGLELDGRNAITQLGDARSTSVDFTAGTNFDKGRGNIAVSLGLLDQSPVRQDARKFSAYSLQDGCAIPGTQDEDYGFSAPAPDPDFDCADEGEELGYLAGGSGLTPEGVIRSPTFLPGTGGFLIRSTQTRFAPGGTLVRYNPSVDAYNYAPENYLQVQLRRISANLFARYEASEHFEPYFHGTYVRTRSPSQLAPVAGILGGGNGTVPQFAINLDNPFLAPSAARSLDISYGVDAQGDRGVIGNAASGFTVNPAYDGDADGIIRLPGTFGTRLTGLGPRRIENKRDAWRILGGVRGRIAGDFHYDAYFSNSNVVHDTPLANSASALRLQQAVLARATSGGTVSCIDPSGGCVPVNIFGQQDISPEAAAFIRGDIAENTRVKEQIAEATVKGPLAQLPAGPLQTAFGAHWRRTSFAYSPDESLEAGDVLGFTATAGSSGLVSVAELFGEALIPILADKRFAHRLSAEVGVRYSHYSSVGGIWTWKAMANWAPIAELRFRGGLQKATRAPNVRELYERRFTDIGFGIDVCSVELGLVADPAVAAACAVNGATALPEFAFTLVGVQTGGSPDLKPETARTLTLGMVAQPVKGLSVSLDYYDIDIRDVIGPGGGGPTFATVACIFGGGDPASDDCLRVPRGPDGSLASIDLTTTNLERLRTRGIDWQLAYTRPMLGGTVSLNLTGNRLLALRNQPSPNFPALKCEGHYYFPCGPDLLQTGAPRWKLFNRLTWSSGPVAFSLRHRYFSATRASLFAIAESIGAQLFPIPKRAEYVEARHYFDLATSFEIGENFDLTLGVNNLTNVRPSLLGSGQSQANTIPQYYDVLGRRFFISVRARVN